MKLNRRIKLQRIFTEHNRKQKWRQKFRKGPYLMTKQS